MSHFITGRKYVPSKICPILFIGRKSVHFIYWSIICPSKKCPGAFKKAHQIGDSSDAKKSESLMIVFGMTNEVGQQGRGSNPAAAQKVRNCVNVFLKLQSKFILKLYLRLWVCFTGILLNLCKYFNARRLL